MVGFDDEGPGTAIETKGNSYEQGHLYLEHVRNLLLTSFATHRSTGEPFIEIAGHDNSFELALLMGGKGQPKVGLVQPYIHFSKQDIVVHLKEGEGYQREACTPGQTTRPGPHTPPAR